MTGLLGLDLGGTHVRALVVDASGPALRVLGRDKRRTPQDSLDAIVAAVEASARAALHDAGVALGDLVAIGCAAPGPLDHRTGVVQQTPNLTALVDAPFGARLARAFGRPVAVDRDAVMAAIGESLAGAAVGCRDFVYVTVSTGVGGAVVVGGRVLRGTGGLAGEVGHWPVALPGLATPICGCGAPGCVEAFAGGKNLARLAGRADAAAVYLAAGAGDTRSGEAVRAAEQALGSLAVGLVNVLNPALIVVGGAIAESQPTHVIEPMRRAIRERAFEPPAAAVEVAPAALAADVGPIGAALAARELAAGRGEWFAS